jgi:hypothetical protein
MLTDPAVGDGRPFIINSRADGDSTLPSPQAQLQDLTIAVLEIIHTSLGYEGRAAVSFLELPMVNGKYVGCCGTIYREGARVMFIPDSEN